jgi:heme/copper-type cytochrome/quinol oxidase subunit 1
VGDKPGFWGFMTTVDHKRIAARYIMTALGLLFLAGVLAVDMRLQLSQPEYTAHGAPKL